MEIQDTLSHVQDGIVPLEERKANQWTGEFFHNDEYLVKFNVADFKFQLDWALRSLQLSISNLNLEVGCWALFDNRLRVLVVPRVAMGPLGLSQGPYSRFGPSRGSPVLYSNLIC